MDQVATAADMMQLRRAILTESDPVQVQALLRVWFGLDEERRAA
jgi:hypothetical protein